MNNKQFTILLVVGVLASTLQAQEESLSKRSPIAHAHLTQLVSMIAAEKENPSTEDICEKIGEKYSIKHDHGTLEFTVIKKADGKFFIASFISDGGWMNPSSTHPVKKVYHATTSEFQKAKQDLWFRWLRSQPNELQEALGKCKYHFSKNAFTVDYSYDCHFNNVSKEMLNAIFQEVIAQKKNKEAATQK